MRQRRLALLVVLVATLAATAAMARSDPFGVVTPDSGGGFGGPLGPFFLWVASYQTAFYKVLSDTLAALKENPWGIWLLIGVSFAYGVFHAAGPGHGKAVITSYLLSSGESFRRGVLISFAAAMVQAASAIVVVLVGAIALRLTAPAIRLATDWVEVASYAAIAAVGAWLLWSKTVGGGHHHHHHHHDAGGHGHEDHDDHDHHGHDHDHGDHDHHGHDHHHHGHDAAHAHDRATARKADGGPLRAVARAWSAIVAVGVRPCSGAIIVLVFALSQGLLAAGIAATIVMGLGTGLTVAALAGLAVSAKGLAVRLAGADTPAAANAVRALEVLAAAGILIFGLVLLGGALAEGLPH